MSDLLDEIVADALLDDGATPGQVAFATGLNRNEGKKTPPRGRYWTEDEDTYLREHYETQSDEKIGAALGRTARSVYGRRVIKLRLLRRAWRRPGRRAEVEATFDAIVRYKQAHDGNSPPLAWIGEAIGLDLKSPQSIKSQVQDYIAELEEQGRIKVDHGRGRWNGIEVAGAQWLPPAGWKGTTDE